MTVDVDVQVDPIAAVNQWLSGSTAKAYRPTLDQLEAAGYVVVPRGALVVTAATLVSSGDRETLERVEAAGYLVVKQPAAASSTAALVTLGELRALVDACRAGYAPGGAAVATLRHLEDRLKVRLRQCVPERTP